MQNTCMIFVVYWRIFVHIIMLLVVIIMFYNVWWGFSIDPPYFGYNSTGQENPILHIFYFQKPSWTQIDQGFFGVLIFYHENLLEIKKSTRRGPDDKQAQVARAPARMHHPVSFEPRNLVPSIFISWSSAWAKNPYIKTPLDDRETRRRRNTKHRNRGCPAKIGGGNDVESPPVASPPSPMSTPPSPPWRGSSPPLDYGFVAIACPISSCTSLFRHHMSCPTWLWCIVCNSYMVDLYIIGWLMRCDMLLCSWRMSRCIFSPYSLLLVLIQHVCEGMWEGWYVLVK
jgi:hypothetical protein